MLKCRHNGKSKRLESAMNRRKNKFQFDSIIYKFTIHFIREYRKYEFKIVNTIDSSFWRLTVF